MLNSLEDNLQSEKRRVFIKRIGLEGLLVSALSFSALVGCQEWIDHNRGRISPTTKWHSTDHTGRPAEYIGKISFDAYPSTAEILVPCDGGGELHDHQLRLYMGASADSSSGFEVFINRSGSLPICKEEALPSDPPYRSQPDYRYTCKYVGPHNLEAVFSFSSPREIVPSDERGIHGKIIGSAEISLKSIKSRNQDMPKPTLGWCSHVYVLGTLDRKATLERRKLYGGHKIEYVKLEKFYGDCADYREYISRFIDNNKDEIIRLAKEENATIEEGESKRPSWLPPSWEDGSAIRNLKEIAKNGVIPPAALPIPGLRNYLNAEIEKAVKEASWEPRK